MRPTFSSITQLILVLALSTPASLAIAGSRTDREAGISLRRQIFEATVSPRAGNSPPTWIRELLETSDTALGNAKLWSELKSDIASVPANGALAVAQHESDLSEAFKSLRDDRFAFDRTRSLYRRLSWFYPDDGCYMRAESGVRHLRSRKKLVPTKIFVFGALRVKTTHHPEGLVKWWYHVAPVAKLDQEIFVLDPAIDASGPMPVDSWLKTMSAEPDTLKVSFCESDTYTPSKPCLSSPQNLLQSVPTASVVLDQDIFLNREWDRVAELGWDPHELLGENSPFDRPESEFRKVSQYPAAPADSTTTPPSPLPHGTDASAARD